MLEFEAMDTCDALEDLEDIFPTRGDHGLDSSKTRDRLVGRDTPGNINARFGRRRICIRQHQDEF